MDWYVVHAYSGFEEKVRQSIIKEAERLGLQSKIAQILVPTERVIEVRSGKKRETDRQFYPGYVLVQMDLNDDTWHLIKSVPRVTGFVGGAKPAALPAEEVELIVRQMETGPRPRIRAQYQRGESVRITDGPFASFMGLVEEVDTEHGKLRVMVSIFGRQTPVELEFFQVEKE